MNEKPAFYAIIPASVRYDENLSANAKLLYGEITALTSQKGYCWASNAYFARLYGVHVNAISKWIKQLIEANHIYSVVDRAGGNRRTISVVDPITQKRDSYHTKALDPITQKGESINTSITTKKGYSSNFEKFWEEYPRKQGKQAAWRKWQTTLKDKGVTIDQLIASAKNYARETKDTDMKYIKLGQTFLGPDRHWEDFILGTPADKRKKLKRVPNWECPKCGAGIFNTGSFCSKCREFTRPEAVV